MDTIHVTAGERYVLYIDNFSWNGVPYALTFQLTEGAALECAPLPEAAFAVSDNSVLVNEPVDFADMSTGAPYAWQWQFPGAEQPLSMEQDPTGVRYALPGCYDVSLTATNIAGSDPTTYACAVEVSVSSAVNGSPNANTTARIENGVLTIERPGRTDLLEVSLMDASGRLVSRFSDLGARIAHSLSSLRAGCYSLLLSDGSGVLNSRLVLGF